VDATHESVTRTSLSHEAPFDQSSVHQAKHPPFANTGKHPRVAQPARTPLPLLCSSTISTQGVTSPFSRIAERGMRRSFRHPGVLAIL